MVFVGTCFAQVVKPDTLFFTSGHVLACKILTHSNGVFVVLSDPARSNIEHKYYDFQLTYYSISGKIDSIPKVDKIRNNAKINDSIVISDKNSSAEKDCSLNSGILLKRAGNNLLISDGLLLGAGLFGSVGIGRSDKTSQEFVIVGAILCSVASIVLRFVGHAQITKSGKMLIEASKNVTFTTTGTGVAISF